MHADDFCFSVHEAGHCAAALAVGIDVESAELFEPGDRRAGQTTVVNVEAVGRPAYLVFVAGGPAAQALVAGESDPEWRQTAKGDLREAAARLGIPEASVLSSPEWAGAFEVAEGIVADKAAEIVRMAKDLVSARVLDRSAILAHFASKPEAPKAERRAIRLDSKAGRLAAIAAGQVVWLRSRRIPIRYATIIDGTPQVDLGYDDVYFRRRGMLEGMDLAGLQSEAILSDGFRRGASGDEAFALAGQFVLHQLDAVEAVAKLLLTGKYVYADALDAAIRGTGVTV